MRILILVLLLSSCATMPNCPETEVTFGFGQSWQSGDSQALKSARETCATKYAPDVCLINFRKYNTHDYFAICGEQR